MNQPKNQFKTIITRNNIHATADWSIGNINNKVKKLFN